MRIFSRAPPAPLVDDRPVRANVVDGVGTVEIKGKEHPPSAICVDEFGQIVRADGWSVAPGSDPIDGPVVWTKDGVEVVWARPGRDQDWDSWGPSQADAPLSHSRSPAEDDATECYTFNLNGLWGDGWWGAPHAAGAGALSTRALVCADSEAETGAISGGGFVCVDSTQPAWS